MTLVLPYLIGYAVFVLFVAFLILQLLPHWRGMAMILATTLIGTVAVALAVAVFLSMADPQSLVTTMMTPLLLVAIGAASVIGFVVSSLVTVIWRTPDPPEDDQMFN